MKKILVLVGTLLVACVFFFVFLHARKANISNPQSILSFEDCAQAGYPVLESHPRQCKTPDGRTYAEEIPEKITYTNSSADLIAVDLPFPGAVTGKNFTVIGKARGTWFFEASFPVQVYDQNGNQLAQVVAQAQGDWMTENFVPFKAEVVVPSTYTGPATLVLHKDNPSGLPEHEASISFPITIEY